MRRFFRKSILQGFGCSKAVRARVCELRGREKSRLCASALPPLRAEQSHCQLQSLSCSETGCCKLLQACARASWRAGEHAISNCLQCVGVVRWCVVPKKGASVRARSLPLKRALCTQLLAQRAQFSAFVFLRHEGCRWTLDSVSIHTCVDANLRTSVRARLPKACRGASFAEAEAAVQASMVVMRKRSFSRPCFQKCVHARLGELLRVR